MSLKSVLKHALKLNCPRCGKFPIFKKWATLNDKCTNCGLTIAARESDTYFFMYMSAGSITAFFIITTYMMAPPENIQLGRFIVAAMALLLFFITMPVRKSIAIALEFYSDHKSQYPRFRD